MEKNSFILYTEDLDIVINEFGSDEFSLGQLLIAINNYVKTKEEPQFKFEPLVSMAFKFIKNKIDRDFDKWEQTKLARSEAGKKHKGNQYSKRMEQNGTNGTSVPKMEQMEQNGTNGTNGTEYVNDYVNVNVNDYVNVNDNVSVNSKKSVPKARFTKPTKEEITDFAITNNLSTDMVDEYFDYYEGNGWKVGRNPMKDWKATYRRWCRNSFKSHKKDEIEEILNAGRDL